jgi:hypothetical protein
MLRSICLSMVKFAAVVVVLGIGTSACWVRGGTDYGGRRGGDHHEERHEERR